MTAAKPLGVREKLAVDELVFTTEKAAGTLNELAPFLRDRGILYLEEWTENLPDFWGNLARPVAQDRATGEPLRQPKSHPGKQENQEFPTMFFGLHANCAGFPKPTDVPSPPGLRKI
jgi:hypothetical protein